MLKLLTCVQGHFWEVAQPSDNGEASDPAAFRCPVCGAPADELPLLDLAPSDVSSAITVEPPPAPKAPPLLDAKGLPVVSGYDILEALGKNKKGVLVYRAKQVLINRLVLLKVVLAKDDVGQIAWGALRGEANTLAKLAHPNIPQIHEVGERERQLFYNIVELFEGVPLSEKLQGKPVPPMQAAKFVENVARAVHFAHEHGVVHRGLKPASLLVETADGQRLDQWTFKIDDFGLAGRPIEGDINDVELQGKLPHYLAPEQAWGYAKDIGSCSDVYALGVLLYELLAGRPPFRGERASEIIEQIRSRPPTPPRDVNRRVPTDLDAICRKCLQKPPRKRYASALALADDLRRYQDGLPVQAHDNGPGTRLFLWMRRRPAMAFILLLLCMMFFSTLLAFAIGLSQGDSDSDRYNAALRDMNTAKSDANNARLERNQAVEREKLANYYQEILLAATLNEGRLEILNRCPMAYRQWEWHYLANNQPVQQFKPEIKAIVTVAFSPDGKWLVVAGDNPKTGAGVVYLLDAASGRVQDKHDIANGHVQDVAFSPDSLSLAILYDDGPPNVNLHHLDVYNVQWRGAPQLSLAMGRATSVAYSPNGLYLALGGSDGQPWLLNASDGSSVIRGSFGRLPQWAFGQQKVRVAFGNASQLLAVWDSQSGAVAVYDVASGANLGPHGFPPPTATSLSFASEERIALGCSDKTVHFWDKTLQERQTSPLHYKTNVEQVLFSRDGQRLAVLTKKGDATKPPVLHWYDGTTLREILAVTDLPNQVNAIALDKQGRRLAVATATDVRIYGATNP
jgi:serine/threonine protein kinase/WD40 repeat protein